MMALAQQTLHSENEEPKRSRKVQGCILSDNSLLARDRVPHAGATQGIHVLHDDKGSLFQGHNAQVIILTFLRVRVQLKAWPHVIFHLQLLFLPFPHLQRHKAQNTDWELCHPFASPTAAAGLAKRTTLLYPKDISGEKALTKGIQTRGSAEQERCWSCLISVMVSPSGRVSG